MLELGRIRRDPRWLRVCRLRVELRDGFLYGCARGQFLGFGGEASRHYIAEPIAHSAGYGVDGCMRGVHADAFLGEAEEGGLLGVV